jgi:hypothetical protein
MKMNIKKLNKKKLSMFIALFAMLLVGFLSMPFLSNHSQTSTTRKNPINLLPFGNTIASQELIFEDNNATYSGIGDAWNITHYANATDSFSDISFTNGSSSTVEIPLNGWEGYRLESTVENLYDTRNWNNGSFHYGVNDSYSAGDNDTEWIENEFQNWTFNEIQATDWSNPMSGNYINNGTRDYLELRMDAEYDDSGETNYWRYDSGDKCWWETYIQVPRGQVSNYYLTFDVNPYHLLDKGDWELAFYVNNEKIYSYSSITLLNQFSGWNNLIIPKSIWYNQSVFSNPINSSEIKLDVYLDYLPEGNWGFTTDGDTDEYQQIFIDNVELWMKAEADPEDINLQLNDTQIESRGWGEGYLQYDAPDGRWTGSNVQVTFDCSDPVALSNYTIELDTDLKLYSLKNVPESNWKEDTSEAGTNFEVIDGGNVNWLTYANIQFPESFEETNLTISFPEDVNITEVYSPTDTTRTNNLLGECDNSTQGLLSIPVSNITNVNNGFFQLKGVSPNYCEDLKFYNNHTGGWVENSTLLSGDYLNITAEITKNALVSSYLIQTEAILTIRFPNGTIWKTQSKSVGSEGYVYFEPILIPSIPPEYEFGEYEVAVYWNNSFSSFELNETGVIYNSFTVVHNAILEPEEGSYDSNYAEGAYFIEDVPDGIIKNIYIEFYDEVDSSAITDEFAMVYTDYSGFESLTMVSDAGIYLLEYNTSDASAGNNTITIYGNSTYHVNQQINLTIEIEKETTLMIEEDFFENVAYNQNFTVRFNYTEENNPSNGVDITSFSTGWKDGYWNLNEITVGEYELTCNTSAYQANEIRNFTITADADDYEKQIDVIRVMITELSSNLTLYLNGDRSEANDKITAGIYQQVNITVKYHDEYENHIPNATVYATGGGFGQQNLTEFESAGRYTLILNASDLGQTIDSLSVYAKASNYNLKLIPFLIEITEEDSDWELFLNGDNKTIDPALEIPISTLLNISVKYTNQTGAHIQDSNITLIGEELSEDIPYNDSTDFNTLLINTTEQLSIGVNLFTIVAEGTNYQTQTIDLRLTIRRINVEITPISHNATISVTPGSSFNITVALNNTDFGGLVKNATVTYNWAFGIGFLNDTNNNGIYTHRFSGVLEGTYELRIYGSAGDNYKIEQYTIIVSAITPESEYIPTYLTLLSNYFKAQQQKESFRRGLIISIIAGVVVGGGLASYLGLYVLYLRYPPAIRKLKRYRKSLKRRNAPDITITSRREGFQDTFREKAGKKYTSSIDKKLK